MPVSQIFHCVNPRSPEFLRAQGDICIYKQEAFLKDQDYIHFTPKQETSISLFLFLRSLAGLATVPCVVYKKMTAIHTES